MWPFGKSKKQKEKEAREIELRKRLAAKVDLWNRDPDNEGRSIFGEESDTYTTITINGKQIRVPKVTMAGDTAPDFELEDITDPSKTDIIDHRTDIKNKPQPADPDDPWGQANPSDTGRWYRETNALKNNKYK